jgi:poly(hydroxyalkanoate) granule-associated protein
MVKRLKAMADKAARNGQLAAAVRESAQQIWLAGLGAFAKAQEEGQKVFDTLVREGTTLQKKTVRLTGESVNEVTGRFTRAADDLQKQANGTWDKLEGVFEERVARAMGRLGVPTKREIADLTRRVEELTESVNALSGARAPKTAVKRARRPAAKTAAKTAEA